MTKVISYSIIQQIMPIFGEPRHLTRKDFLISSAVAFGLSLVDLDRLTQGAALVARLAPAKGPAATIVGGGNNFDNDQSVALSTFAASQTEINLNNLVLVRGTNEAQKAPSLVEGIRSVLDSVAHQLRIPEVFACPIHGTPTCQGCPGVWKAWVEMVSGHFEDRNGNGEFDQDVERLTSPRKGGGNSELQLWGCFPEHQRNYRFHSPQNGNGQGIYDKTGKLGALVVLDGPVDIFEPDIDPITKQPIEVAKVNGVYRRWSDNWASVLGEWQACVKVCADGRTLLNEFFISTALTREELVRRGLTERGDMYQFRTRLQKDR